jgi:hypothetical protein
LAAIQLHFQCPPKTTDYACLLVQIGKSSRTAFLICEHQFSSSGGLAILTPPMAANKTAPWVIHGSLREGVHTGVVRSAFWDEPSNILLTGGEEDAKLCMWSVPPLSAADASSPRPGSGLGGRGVLHEESEESATDEDAMDVDGPRRRKRADDGAGLERVR